MLMIPTPFSCPFALGRSRPRASSSFFLWAPPPTTSAQFFAHFSRPTYAFPVFFALRIRAFKKWVPQTPYKKTKRPILLFPALVWQWNIHFSRPSFPAFRWYEAISWLVLCRVFNLFPGHDLFPYIRGENNNNENTDLAVSLAIGKTAVREQKKIENVLYRCPSLSGQYRPPENYPISQIEKIQLNFYEQGGRGRYEVRASPLF